MNQCEASIRGHHLRLLKDVDKIHLDYEAAYADDPSTLAESDVRSWMREELWDMTASLGKLDDYGEYCRDVIGEASKVPLIARTFAQALLGWYRLPVDTEILVHDTKDLLCNGCAVGKHCEEITYTDDRQYMKDIAYYAQKMNLPCILENGYLRIEAGNLRTILREMNRVGGEFTFNDRESPSILSSR